MKSLSGLERRCYHRARRDAGWLTSRVVVLVLLGASPARAGEPVLSHVDTAVVDGTVDVTIHLNVPMRYLSHTSSGNGDTVRVQLAPFSVEPAEQAGVGEEETLSWDPSASASLVEVRYEPAAAALFLRFSRRVEAEVRGSADLRSIVVTVARPQQEREKRDQRIGGGPQRSRAQRAAGPAPPAEPEAAAPSTTSPSTETLRYAINLVSTLAPIDIARVARLPEFEPYRLYVASYERDGKIWHRLRLGFFANRVAAGLVANAARKQYPQAWVTKVAAAEAAHRAKTAAVEPAQELPGAVPRPATEPATVQTPAHLPSLAPTTAERTAEFYDEAKRAMTAGNYDRVVKLCTKLLQYPDHPHRRDALELLGLARERKGQSAHAKAEYEEFLRLYPQGEASQRVRQRLAALVTARRPLKEKLREVQPRSERSRWDVFGSMSQFYRRDESFTDVAGRRLDNSTLSNDINASVRTRGKDYAIRTQITGGYEHNFIEGVQSDVRISELYVDADRFTSGASARVGRQSRSIGGVLGRFDGALVGYRFGDALKANLVAGFPVDASTIDTVNTDKYFYGLSFDLGTFRKYWDFNAYIIEQRVDAIADRRAIGGEARYFDGSRSLFGAVDYDILFNELNSAILLGTVTNTAGTTFNLSLDYRKSPVLAASNALGSPIDPDADPIGSIDDLLDIYTSRQVRDCASSLTADSRTATIGASHPLSGQLQLSGDFMVSNLSDTDDACGMTGDDGTGNEFFYSTQLVGSSLFKQGDITILGLRYSDTSSAKSVSADLNTRYPVTAALRFNPRLKTDYRRSDAGGEDYGAQASARLEYRWRRRMRLELELGGEWSDDNRQDAGEELGYFLNVGYRWDF